MKTRLHFHPSWRLITICIVTMWLCIAGGSPAEASEATTVTLDSSGWSISGLGTWNAATREATLTTDLARPLVMRSVSLDGASHAISGHVTIGGNLGSVRLRNVTLRASAVVNGNATVSNCDVLSGMDLSEGSDLDLLQSTVGGGIGGGGYESLTQLSLLGNVLMGTSIDLGYASIDALDNQFVDGALYDWNAGNGLRLTGNAFVDYVVRPDMSGFVVEHNDFFNCPGPIDAPFQGEYDDISIANSNFYSDQTSPDANSDGIVDTPRFICWGSEELSGEPSNPSYDMAPHVYPHRPLPEVSINGGASRTSFPAVSLESSTSAIQLRVRENRGPWSGWRPYQSVLDWTLSSGEGTKTLDVEYRYASGKLLVASDSIVLQELAKIPSSPFEGSGIPGSEVAYEAILPSGRTVAFSMTRTSGDANFDISLADPSGKEVASANRAGATDRLVFTTVAAGAYTFRVRTESGSGTYRIAYPEPDDQIPGQVWPGTPICGSGGRPGDVFDVYAVDLIKGVPARYRCVRTEGVADFGIYLCPPGSLDIYDRDWVAQSTGEVTGAGVEEITYTPTVGGTHYLVVEAFNDASNTNFAGSGAYLLTGPQVDDNIPGDPVPASPFKGSLSATDPTDVFAVRLTGGQPTTFSLRGEAGTDFDLLLHDSSAESVATERWTPIAQSIRPTYPDSVTYTPPSTGIYYLLVRRHSGAGNYLLTHPLQPRSAIDPTGVDFGEVFMGSTTTKRVTVANTGDAVLKLSGRIAPGSGFRISGQASTSLVPGSSASLDVVFRPTVLGSATGTLTVVTNDPASPKSEIKLSGVAAPAPNIRASAGRVAFGSIFIGTSRTRSVAVYNTGAAPLTISRVALTPPVPGVSVIGPMSAVVPAGGAVSYTFVFQPVVAESVASRLCILSNDPDLAMMGIDVTGTGLEPPDISASPSPVVFGDIQVGRTASCPVVVSNTGAAPLVISARSTTGIGLSVSGVPTTTVSPGDTVVFTLRYRPSSCTALEGSLRVRSNDPETSTLVIPVSGCGIPAPNLAVSPSSLSFGPVYLGYSVTRAIKLTNTGGASLHVSGCSMDPAVSGLSVTPVSGAIIAPGATVMRYVTYSPEMNQSAVATLVISSDDPETPVKEVPISVSGLAP